MVETALFAAGCFWGVEEVFSSCHGVIKTRVGYCGGRTDNPTYRDVCNHGTGHAETVEVTFDTGLTSFRDLLNVFWECHDPTQVNRQGPDFGEQYRSAIFYFTEQQHEEALASRTELEESRHFRASIATLIEPASTFWLAEEYHQQYHKKHGGGCGF